MSQFDYDQEFYETHRAQASEYCRILSKRMQELRKQLKNLERAFVVSANIKRICELEIIPIKTIPNGMTKRKAEEQTKALMTRVMEDKALQKALRELLRKEGHIV